MKAEIPLGYLKAARLFTFKKDVRFCVLEGVALKNGYVVGTTGACLGAIRCHALDGLPEIIIPNQPLDFFLKKAASYRSIELPVLVEWDDKRKGTLSIGSDVEHFVGIDGTYPDFLRVIPSHTAPTGHPQFNWDLFQPFQKAAVALGTKTTADIKALLIPGGDDATARVVLAGYPEFSGAISPLRSNTYAAAIAAFKEENK